jgi:glycosyltransferase involved in cell wall biosynthesis
MEMGGAEMLVAQLARLQRKRGHDVRVVCYSKLGALGEGLIADGIPVRVLGEAPVWKTVLRYWKLFREMRPDVVHMHNPAPTLQAAPGARLSGAKCVISTRHSLVEPPYATGEELKFSAWSWLWLDWVVGICEITCANLRGAPGARKARIVRVYNGAGAVESSGSPHLIRRDVGHPVSGEFRLLFVGRMAKIKDLGTMIGGVARAVKSVPGLRLDVVGDGPVRAEMEALATSLGVGDVVRFHGQQMETAAYFSAADCFCMSSVSEGLPMSLVQAMSMGLPAICTEVGGMQEVVGLSGGGLLVPVGDAAAYAEAIVKMASDAAMRAELGRKAREAYERHFTLEQMEESYARLYAAAR